jgi:hypothetical protein
MQSFRGRAPVYVSVRPRKSDIRSGGHHDIEIDMKLSKR